MNFYLMPFLCKNRRISISAKRLNNKKIKAANIGEKKKEIFSQKCKPSFLS